jgi:hypothetical protein
MSFVISPVECCQLRRNATRWAQIYGPCCSSKLIFSYRYTNTLIAWAHYRLDLLLTRYAEPIDIPDSAKILIHFYEMPRVVFAKSAVKLLNIVKAVSLREHKKRNFVKTSNPPTLSKELPRLKR